MNAGQIIIFIHQHNAGISGIVAGIGSYVVQTLWGRRRRITVIDAREVLAEAKQSLLDEQAELARHQQNEMRKWVAKQYGKRIASTISIELPAGSLRRKITLNGVAVYCCCVGSDFYLTHDAKGKGYSDLRAALIAAEAEASKPGKSVVAMSGTSGSVNIADWSCTGATFVAPVAAGIDPKYVGYWQTFNFPPCGFWIVKSSGEVSYRLDGKDIPQMPRLADLKACVDSGAVVRCDEQGRRLA